MDNRTIEEIRNNETKLINEIKKLEKHQKEFIEYLEQEIRMEEVTFEKYGNGNINRYYVAANKVTLKKYKEIIGSDK